MKRSDGKIPPVPWMRRFLKTASPACGVILALVSLCWIIPADTFAFEQSPEIPLFKTTLRGVGPGGIPVASPDPYPAPVTGVTHYTIDINQFQDQILPLGFGQTTLWGYNPAIGLGGNNTPTHLGGIIIGQKGTPIQITFRNKLHVKKHILPVDTTIPGGKWRPTGPLFTSTAAWSPGSATAGRSPGSTLTGNTE